MPEDELIPDFTRRRIRAVAEQCLRESNAIDVLPTPLDAVGRAAGMLEVVSIDKLPDEVARQKPPAWKRILGAVLFEEQVVFIDRSQDEVRQRFTEAHEAAHLMLPWHRPGFRLDHEGSLRDDTRERLEAEANLGAAHLLFQGDRFHARAAAHQVGMATALALGPGYGGSAHAALHYYVEHHPSAAVALLIAGRYPLADQTLPVWRSVGSPGFRERFGDLQHLLPGGSLALAGERAIFGEVIERAWTATSPPRQDVYVPDRGGQVRPFVAEGWFNRRCVFVMISEKRARRLGRRVRLAS